MNKVLIIDDDVFLTELYSRLLKIEGLEVQLEHSGAAALTRIADFRPNLIVLDLHMPGMHGTEVLRAIHADANLKHTPVIVFSTGYIKTLISEVGDFGVHKVFSKMQCKPRMLVAEIKDSLKNMKEATVKALENRSALEAGADQLQDPEKEQLSTWIDRIRTDDRNEARRICLLHLYRIMQKDLDQVMQLDESKTEAKLGHALKKLMEDLFDHPERIRNTTVDSLEQALQKLLVLTQNTLNTELDSEAKLQDLLKGL